MCFQRLYTTILNDGLKLYHVDRYIVDETEQNPKKLFSFYPSEYYHELLGHHVYGFRGKNAFISFLTSLQRKSTTPIAQIQNIQLLLNNMWHNDNENDIFYHPKYITSKRYKKVIIIYHPHVIPFIIWLAISSKNKWIVEIEDLISELKRTSPPKDLLQIFSKSNNAFIEDSISIVSLLT